MPTPDEGPGRGRERSLDRLLQPTVAVPAVVALVSLLVGAAQLFRDWHPVGDWAVAELVLRHTDRYLPLSGPYSAQRGYDHPLPLVYAIQWPLYHLLGGRSSAGLATTVWWNGAWLTFLTWMLARARATWLGVGCLVAVAVMSAHAVTGALLLPWNPSLALIPSMVLVVVAWRVATGSRRLLPVMAGLAVWCGGAHLGFIPSAAAVSVAAIGGLVVVTVRRGGRAALRDLLRPALLALATTLVLVSPLLLDLATHGADSNPAHIVERGRPAPGAVRVDGDQLVEIFTAELAVPPAWATTRIPYVAYLIDPPMLFPVGLALGAIAAVAAWRRRAHDEVVALGIALLGLAAAVAGLSNVDRGILRPWYLMPAHAASMAFWAFALWSVARSIGAFLSSRRPLPSSRTAQRASTAAAAGVALLAMVLVVPSLHLSPSARSIAPTAAALAAQVEAEIDAGSAVELAGPIAVDGYLTQALALRLDRAGFDVRVPDRHLYLFSPALERPDDWRGSTLQLRIVPSGEPPPSPDARLLATAPVDHPFAVDADVAEVWDVTPQT